MNHETSSTLRFAGNPFGAILNKGQDVHRLVSLLFLVGWFGAPVELLSDGTRACSARVQFSRG